MRAIIAVSAALDRAARWGAAIGFTAMLVFVAIQVVARYIFDSPPIWTEELARYAMVWAGLLGAACAFRAGVDPVLVRRAAIPGRGVGHLLRLLRAAAALIFVLPVLYYCLFGAGADPSRGYIARAAAKTADTLGFPMIWVAAAVPVALALIVIHILAFLAAGRDSYEAEQVEAASRESKP
ncbi:TRAP transporter small permease [Marinibaculum pumilum]|uniref:TRAP transporter small permease protein n=1 Tax=Marinibaculum pumilum TaxID=1766165 RepID=A0ABV7L1U4_9PROT